MGKVPTKTIFVLFLVVLAFLAVQDFALHGADGVFGDYLHRVFDEEAQDFRGWENMPQARRPRTVRRRGTRRQGTSKDFRQEERPSETANKQLQARVGRCMRWQDAAAISRT
ncbi:MAG: hypothetical protein H5T97_08965 [Firmicutes bacterium]|nr:hypothetical protein [Bacillota bacterium]